MRWRMLVAAVAPTVIVLTGCAPPRASDAGDRVRPTITVTVTAPGAPEGSTQPGPASPSLSTPVLPPGEDTSVARVVDGDTLVVADDRRIRLIGIDTPETVHPRRPVECFGREASAHLAALVPAGAQVRLEYDVERDDPFGRTLAYVWRPDGLFVNEAMLADGFAQVATFPPNVRHVDRFLAAQRAAREAGRGLWGACPSVE